MATVLRSLSYRHQWLYDLVSHLASLSVGGKRQFHGLPLQGLAINRDTSILDLCCGGGQATQLLIAYSDYVTGLDASPRSIGRARTNVPQASFVEGWAEEMPFAADSFDIVHTSAAMHEMQPSQRTKIVQEVFRVLKPGGIFTLIDFHAPQNLIYWPGLALFLWLFETQTSWEMIRIDLPQALQDQGFILKNQHLKAGGSLQIIQMIKPDD